MNEIVRLNDQDRPPAAIHCLNFKPHRAGSLVGFCDIHVPRWRVKLFGLTVHQSHGRRWANPPGRPQIGSDGAVLRDDAGKIKYTPLLTFDTDAIRHAFSDAVVAAVESYDARAFDGGDQ